MLPEIDLFGLPLKTFGLCFALSFVVSGAVIARRLPEIGRPPDWAYEIVFAALIGGLIGARLYWAAENPSSIADDPIGGLFGGAGLTWYGGAIGGGIGVWLWARRKGFANLGLLDLCAPALALGYAVGRIGCQISGDGDYGSASGVPWAMAYPDGVVPTEEEVHPTPIYESLSMGLAAYVLWRLRDRLRPGGLFALYLVLSGVARLLVEFVRRNEAVLAGLTMPQVQSALLAIAGAAVLVAFARRPGGLALKA